MGEKIKSGFHFQKKSGKIDSQGQRSLVTKFSPFCVPTFNLIESVSSKLTVSTNSLEIQVGR